MNSSDSDKAKAMVTAENWKFVCEIDGDYTARQFGKELERLCNEHCVTPQNSDDNSMWRYVCKKREELNCNYEMAYIIQEFKLYAKGEHSHKLGNEQQQADQKSVETKAADAQKKKIKEKLLHGPKLRYDWHYLGKATSAQDILQKYTNVRYRTVSLNYVYFCCKHRYVEKCAYTIRWNKTTHETHDIREHNHGTSALARRILTSTTIQKAPLAVQKDKPSSSSKTKESVATTVLHKAAPLAVQKDKPSSSPKTKESVATTVLDKTAPLAVQKDQPSSKTKESATKVATPVLDKATPLAVQKDNPTSSSKTKESANKGYVDRMGRVWDFFGQVGIGQSDAQIRQFGKEHGWSLDGGRAISRERAFFRCRKNRDTCPLRIVVTRKDGKAYKLADHNHGEELEEPKIGKKKPKVAKRGVKKQQKQAEKVQIEGPAEDVAMEVQEDIGMEVQEEENIITVQQNTEDPSAIEEMDATGTIEQEEEEPQGDIATGWESSDDEPDNNKEDFLHTIAEDVRLMAELYSLHFQIDKDRSTILSIAQLENRQLAKRLILKEEGNNILILEFEEIEYTGRRESHPKEVGKAQFLEALDNKCRKCFQPQP